MADYTPPDGDSVILNLTGAYIPPAPDEVILDFKPADTIEAIDAKVTITYTSNTPPAGHMVDGTWAVNPTAVQPIKTWFRATYTCAAEGTSGFPTLEATDVWIEVRRSSDLALVWQSGWLNFRAYEEADNPILANRDWVLRSSDYCEIHYQHDDNHLGIPTAMLRLPRDGVTYQWRIKFYFEDLARESTWAQGTFAQFLEEYLILNPKVEGLTNPSNVTDLTPEFDVSYDSVYTPWHTPYVKGYIIQVATDEDFTSLMWDYIGTLSPVVTPPGNLPQMTYNGTQLYRDNTLYYWRIKYILEAEWGTVESSWVSTQYFQMFNEIFFASDIKINSLTEPTIKDYYPEFTAQFDDNYSPARATHVEFRVLNWDYSVKWSSGWVELATPLEPGQTCDPVHYTQPYISGDDGFYWDGTQYRVQAKYRLFTEVVYDTEYAFSLFTMGVATIDAMLPRVNKVYGIHRVRTYTPAFDAQYQTDAWNEIDQDREYGNHVQIQISTAYSMSPIIWDSGWIELIPHLLDNIVGAYGPYSDMKRIPFGILARDTTYFWKIRFRNERSIVGNWSEVCTFICLGYTVSTVSDTDIINAFWLTKEYEVYAQSKYGTIFLTVLNATDGTVVINEREMNKGVQPRLIFDDDTGIITMLFISNGKLFKRTWGILETPDTAPTTAPQLIDGAMDSTKSFSNPIDIMDIAYRPFEPTNIFIYRGSINDESGNIYPSKPYVVGFTVPNNHTYFYNDKTYKVYVENGTYDASYDYATPTIKAVSSGSTAFMPAANLGCDITNTQRSRLGPWLPDMSNEYIETILKRASYAGNITIGIDTLGFNFTASLKSNVTLESEAKLSVIQWWRYKKSIWPDLDVYGYTGFGGMLKGNVSTESQAPYSEDNWWRYKKTVWPEIDELGGDTEQTTGYIHSSLVGNMPGYCDGPKEWTVDLFHYGQWWDIENYYSERVR